jgi:chemotaxis protein CheC
MTPPAAPLARRDVDALQELMSIGSGHALTALGKLVGRRVDMDVPEAWIGRGPGAVADFLGALGEDLVAIGVRLEGVLAGHLVLALPEHDAEELAARLGRSLARPGLWDALAESALMETTNIVGSSFVSAIAGMVREKLLLSVPRLVRGGGQSCLERLVDREEARTAFATRFSVAGAGGLEGLILFLPKPAQVQTLLDALFA